MFTYVIPLQHYLQKMLVVIKLKIEIFVEKGTSSVQKILFDGNLSAKLISFAKLKSLT